MNAIKLNRSTYFLAYGIPFAIIVFSISLAFSSLFSTYPELAIGITYDLTLTSPLIYLFFIRKTNIPKITVVPFFILGVIIASYLIPPQQQYHLGLVKTWILPIVEIGIVGFISYSVYKTVKNYRNLKTTHTDVYKIIQEVSKKTATIPILAKAIAFEIAVFYYAFVSWKKFTPSEKNFTYHKKSGNLTLYAAIILLIAVETFVFHMLIARWNEIIAWILTISSLYVLIQIFAHIKAMLQRPIEITKDKLLIRYGLFGDTEIDLNNIESIEFTNTFTEDKTDVRQVAILKEIEQFNTKISLKEKETYRGFYGIKSKYKTLLLFVDEQEKFKGLIEKNDSN